MGQVRGQRGRRPGSARERSARRADVGSGGAPAGVLARNVVGVRRQLRRQLHMETVLGTQNALGQNIPKHTKDCLEILPYVPHVSCRDAFVP